MIGTNNMMNLKKSEKSKGIVVFAFNSAAVDYVAVADQTSRLTAKHLNLPITLITDRDAQPTFNYDHIIRVDSASGNVRSDLNGKVVEWRNFGRHVAYELSPYDTTILLDGDYLVLDSSLLTLLEQEFDYRLMHNNQNPDGPSYQSMGSLGLPFVWATVVIFRKTPLAKMFFNLVGRVQRNYRYYKTLFNGTGAYRNDYAFAIANIILSGYHLAQELSIPWTMLTIEQKIKQLKIKNNFIVVRQEGKADVIARQNLHIMDKDYLVSNSFKEFVNECCNESI